jgi:hypothetical protein
LFDYSETLKNNKKNQKMLEKYEFDNFRQIKQSSGVFESLYAFEKNYFKYENIKKGIKQKY